MGADMRVELLPGASSEDVRRVMAEALGTEVREERFDEAAGLGGMVWLWAGGLRFSLHVPEEEGRGLTLLARSQRRQVAVGRRLVEVLGGFCCTDDARRWEYDYSLPGPVSWAGEGALTEAELAWAGDRAAYDDAGRWK